MFRDGKTLFVADSSNNRILVWLNVEYLASGQAADLVLGQPDAATTSSGSGSSNLSGPSDVVSDGVHVFASDTNNHRVVIWTTIPNASNAQMTTVLGQASLAGTASALNATGMSSPTGILLIDHLVFISDTRNNRFLGFGF